MGQGLRLFSFSLALAALLLVDVRRATAVVIAQQSTVNAAAPGDDPGWNNVAYLGNGTAVYLGNRWMITAAHLSDATVRFGDGRTYAITVGSDQSIFNSDSSGLLANPDIRLFQISADPGLPALQIGAAAPAQGSQVMMIGAGHAREPNMIGWNTSTWTETILPFAQAIGYNLAANSPNQMHWGVNSVNTNDVLAGDNGTVSFTTRFDRPSISFEGQAVLGDSGGGVFQKDAGGWKLVGIMDSIQGLLGQPSSTVAYGDQTFAADLSIYRDQILALVNRPIPLWQNAINNYDVDNSGKVTPLDALMIINELTLTPNNVHALVGASDGRYLDVTGDSSVSPLDALSVLNQFLHGPSASAASLGGVNFVPEPASGMLFVAGAGSVMLLLLARRMRSRRRSSFAANLED